MNLIGFHVACRFTHENKDAVVIDKNPEAFRPVSDNIDWNARLTDIARQTGGERPLIAAIVRVDDLIIPRGKDRLLPGDIVCFFGSRCNAGKYPARIWLGRPGRKFFPDPGFREMVIDLVHASRAT